MPITHRVTVLGDPIDHSYPPATRNAGCRITGMNDQYYDRIRCNAKELADVIDGANPGFQGFSVTMSGKFAALDFAGEVSERARLIGSADTLVRRDSGWFAGNIDGDGVLETLREIDRTDAPRDCAVVVDVGGTARPTLWALSQLGVSYVTVAAHSKRAYDIEPLAAALGMEFIWVTFDVPNLADIAGNADVPISTVPSAAIELVAGCLTRAPRILNVAYNPRPAPLVKAAERGGTQVVGGLFILLHQAVGQFEQFAGHTPDIEAMRTALPR